MHSISVIASLLVCVSYLAHALHIPSPTPSFPDGKYVRYDDLASCPVLKPRKSSPTSARDIRPDDFKVVMALGDSITAGFLAKGSRDDVQRTSQQLPLLNNRPIALPFVLEEHRGSSYPIGADPDQITIPNILSHYTKHVKGGSIGSHGCLGLRCELHPENDHLNAAVSGAKGENLMSQVKDYLVPTIREMKIEDNDWKFVNLGIGGNDLCSYCLTPNTTSLPLVGTPKQFAKNIKDSVEYLRANVPNIIVNIIGMFRVSAIYRLTVQDPYCSGPLPPLIPHLPLECSCAFLPGPAGDFTRTKMDELSDAYDAAVLEVVKDWEAENDPAFGVIWRVILLNTAGEHF
ncbi:phospholipase B1, membrane-associated, partial [Tremellales sp. Uapishka_1]